MNLMNFLMTPNEVADNILMLLFTFVEATLYLTFFSNLLNLQTTTKQKTIYISLTYIVSILCNTIIPEPFNIVINILLFIALLKYCFKQSLKNTIFAVIFTYFTAFLSTFLIQIIITVLFEISYNCILDIPLYRFLTCLLIYSTLYLINKLIFLLKKNLKKFKISFNTTIIINLILGIVTIFTISYIFSIYKDSFPIILKIITITSLLIYFMISIYSLMRTNILEQTKKDLETEKLYNKTLSLLHDNIRCFKHDFNNIVQAIGGYIALNDMGGLKNYYSQLLNDCKQTNNLNVLNPETINNPSIYSLLTNKYYLACENEVTMTFNIFSDFSRINFDIYEFTRILGILLDNSIEAAKETEEKIINIDFKFDAKKQLFIIENSCLTSNINTDKIFEKGYSTKRHNSGLGLWKVHNILAHNTNINLYTTVKNNRFIQQLEVYYK